MEEKKLSEQESLELISQMIRSTRKNMEVGSGNQVFLLSLTPIPIIISSIKVNARFTTEKCPTCI